MYVAGKAMAEVISDFIAITSDAYISYPSEEIKAVRKRILAELENYLHHITENQPTGSVSCSEKDADARVKAMVVEEQMHSKLKEMSESLEETKRKLEQSLIASRNAQQFTKNVSKLSTPPPGLLAQREKRKRDYEDLDRQFNDIEQLRKKWKSTRATAEPK
ncbi:hypothetical protein PV05_04359 [Exophiala xenobiotica]|uniref:Uncharacterized protein n=1 Tax=Exophiala xenobiotica TaxID=348802 RepID=A0A0D2EJN3_9EURO|nr:uncharacterized protein PV05_04359 [Exophiala xenobiotica]KIW55628.1 hypothetical protein PV05_04359 [Exophiala xenobiotica]